MIDGMSTLVGTIDRWHRAYRNLTVQREGGIIGLGAADTQAVDPDAITLPVVPTASITIGMGTFACASQILQAGPGDSKGNSATTAVIFIPDFPGTPLVQNLRWVIVSRPAVLIQIERLAGQRFDQRANDPIRMGWTAGQIHHRLAEE